VFEGCRPHCIKGSPESPGKNRQCTIPLQSLLNILGFLAGFPSHPKSILDYTSYEKMIRSILGEDHHKQCFHRTRGTRCRMRRRSSAYRWLATQAEKTPRTLMPLAGMVCLSYFLGLSQRCRRLSVFQKRRPLRNPQEKASLKGSRKKIV
jgi:hypothetical protein